MGNGAIALRPLAHACTSTHPAGPGRRVPAFMVAPRRHGALQRPGGLGMVRDRVIGRRALAWAASVGMRRHQYQ